MSDGPSVSNRTLVVALVAVVVAAAAAPTVYQAARPEPPVVMVVELDASISGSTAQQVIEDLREARSNETIEAVVLAVDSPGGGAAASEALYMAVRKTAQQMPVVASVRGLGASGAYYAMVPAEAIYVTPGSLVGSVGVRGSTPSGGDFPGQITTGPDKNGGRTAEEARAQIETLRRAFIESVFAHRGDDLQLSREQVSYAKVYTGASAVRNGMADRIGGVDAAIQRAADEAGLENYRVVREELELGGFFFFAAQGGNGTAVVQREAFDYQTVDSPRFLMLYGEVEGQEVIADEGR